MGRTSSTSLQGVEEGEGEEDLSYYYLSERERTPCAASYTREKKQQLPAVVCCLLRGGKKEREREVGLLQLFHAEGISEPVSHREGKRGPTMIRGKFNS